MLAFIVETTKPPAYPFIIKNVKEHGQTQIHGTAQIASSIPRSSNQSHTSAIPQDNHCCGEAGI